MKFDKNKFLIFLNKNMKYKHSAIFNKIAKFDKIINTRF